MRGFLLRAQRAVGLQGEIGLRLMHDTEIRELNRAFRRHDTPTDVLSFPGDGSGSGYAGDIAISLDTARRQARARRHSLDTEIRILLLHALLHLAGYDHEADDGEMRRRERGLRLKLGLPPGLIERTQRRKIKAHG
ncbi:MAG TPA: rRNA maturation RNase YbeY [Terriglobales bacterium]|nr:rRNA maturation RNase YbeY [Terriglobales bacterium]